MDEKNDMDSELDHAIGDQSEKQSEFGSSSSNSMIYVPEVRLDKKPKIGQKFDSIADAHNFYNEYAREAGFSVRMSSSKKNRSGEIIRKEFVCYKEGVRRKEKPKANSSKRRGLTRVGCGAKMSVVKSPSNQGFIIRQFIEVHNHVLATPRKVHLLRSHRCVSSVKKTLSQQLVATNVSTHQQISILESQQVRGIDNIGCIDQDFYNAPRDEMKMYARHDASMLHEYFLYKQEKNPAFMFSIKNDIESKITHCFWADESCRRAYKAFGDVVVFDTTYNTNRYDMIFVSFLGINHHGQTTLLGCAFLSDETAESFMWLLQQLLMAMITGPPRMIITDQDPAIVKAIAEELPNTLHRFCMWRILSKFSKKIDANKWRDHYVEFQKCISDSETPKEFEESWAKVVEKSDLSRNEWLKVLYDNRSRWIPAYVNDTFSAGMTTSQRAEISHSFFEQYVSKDNSLMDFVVRFTRALKRQRHQELMLDYKDINEQPILKTLWMMEKKMSELYTQKIFYKFQEELFQSMAYVVTMDREIDNQCVYNVQRVDESSERVQKIVEDKSIDYVTCSCKKFESFGIPCRHMLKVFNRKQILQLPDIYILRRWTKAAKSARSFDDAGVKVRGDCDNSLVVRRNSLFRLASNVIDDAMVSEETSKLAIETLDSLHRKIKSMIISNDGRDSTSSVTPLERVYNEPDKVRAKGCGKRPKGGKEKATKKSKRCHGCGLIGQSHDKISCPILDNIASQHGRSPNQHDDDIRDDDEDIVDYHSYIGLTS